MDRTPQSRRPSAGAGKTPFSKRRHGGRLILDRYEVVRTLGEGDSGTVYACRDTFRCNWMVAVKLMPRAALGGRDGFSLVEREAWDMYFLSHRNVAGFYEFIVTADCVGYTMEYIRGGSIADPPNGAGALSIEQIVHRLMQVCSGLRAIHKAGLVHRDLKPKNILLTAQGIVKIVNLGVRLPPSAFHLPRDSGAVKFYDFTNGLRRTVSESEDISGTFDYLSPEQLAGTAVDHRSDIYSLGVIAYELLTGANPFGELSLPNLMWKKTHSDPDSPQLSRTDCPAELAEVVMKALARDPGSRYATAAEMFADLSKIEQAIVRGGDYRLYLRTLKLCSSWRVRWLQTQFRCLVRWGVRIALLAACVIWVLFAIGASGV